MKRHIFLTRRTREVERWREAFPDAEVVSYSSIGTILVARPGEALIWLHLANEPAPVPSGAASMAQERRTDGSAAELVQLAIRLAPGCAVVALSNQTDQEEGITCLEAGASGYTNALSNPEVLRQIATVVENGGLWVGPELMNRLRDSLSRMQPAQIRRVEEKLALLSPREREVALAVAAGASNKEVARHLGITERTVKAHLSAIFERLGARDRMQLAILFGGASA
ncbi:MAG: response regulator transcription factor [Thiobacillus sp.]|nr:response regulator transcription factor [Thiobacillus sp.]